MGLASQITSPIFVGIPNQHLYGKALSNILG